MLRKSLIQITVSAVLLLGHLTFAASAETAAIPAKIKVEIRYDEIKELIENKNSKVQALRLETQAAAEREGYLERSFQPSLELYGTQETFKTGANEQKSQPTYGAELKLNIYNGGRDALESDIRGIQTETKKSRVFKTISEQLQMARSLFWQMQYSSEQISLINSMLVINSENLKSAEKRIRSGIATDLDRVEFQMKATDLTRDLEEAKLKLEVYKKNFILLAGLEANSEIILKAEFTHDHDFEAKLQHSQKDHEFLVKEYDLMMQKGQLAVAQQNRQWWPKIDLLAGYTKVNQRGEGSPSAGSELRDDTFYGVRMTLALPVASESQRESAALAKETQAIAAEAKFVRQELAVHIESELAELRFLHGQVHDADTNILLAEKYYKLTLAEYSRGVRNSPDVLGAADRLFEKKIKRLEITRDFQISQAHLMAKMGK